jgi:hypothetical protein
MLGGVVLITVGLYIEKTAADRWRHKGTGSNAREATTREKKIGLSRRSANSGRGPGLCG